MSRKPGVWQLALRAIAHFRKLSSTSLTAVAVTGGCVAALIASSACGGGGGSASRVAFEAKSPDGASTAFHVDRYVDGHTPDLYEFLVVVAPSNEITSKAARDKDVWKYVVLLGEQPGNLQLQWRDSATLVVSCNGCQVRPQDLRRKEDNSGSVSIVYKGFPEQPAPSTSP